MSITGSTHSREFGKGRWRAFAFTVASLLIVFMLPLGKLALFAFSSELYSYIVLVPAIAVCLVWSKKESLQVGFEPERVYSIFFSAAGLIIIATYWSTAAKGVSLGENDSLAVTTLSFVLLFWGTCCWILGKSVMKAIAFPIGFLILMVPFPEFIRISIEGLLQRESALAALGMFNLAGTPVFFSNLTFQLPDITIKVAPECSGIHSTLALFITSLVAGYIFLRANWKRCTFAIVVVPLAILRNGFRIFTIGELCVHIGPEMIDSNIHVKGGPIFFILSLVPLLILLYFLTRSERLPIEPKPITP